MENTIQNSFFEVIDKTLLGLKRCGYISAKTRKKITSILEREIKWDITP